MDERERLRVRLTSEVMKLARHRSVRDAMPPRWDDGSAPFVVALPDDTLGEVSRRAEAVGGRAHMIVSMLLADLEVGNVIRYHTYDRDAVIRFLNDSVQPVPT